jgi:hypothetical protein
MFPHLKSPDIGPAFRGHPKSPKASSSEDATTASGGPCRVAALCCPLTEPRWPRRWRLAPHPSAETHRHHISTVHILCHQFLQGGGGCRLPALKQARAALQATATCAAACRAHGQQGMQQRECELGRKTLSTCAAASARQAAATSALTNWPRTRGRDSARRFRLTYRTCSPVVCRVRGPIHNG